jgi:hypothetical protein
MWHPTAINQRARYISVFPVLPAGCIWGSYCSRAALLRPRCRRPPCLHVDQPGSDLISRTGLLTKAPYGTCTTNQTHPHPSIFPAVNADDVEEALIINHSFRWGSYPTRNTAHAVQLGAAAAATVPGSESPDWETLCSHHHSTAVDGRPAHGCRRRLVSIIPSATDPEPVRGSRRLPEPFDI